jgi:hypothetical protein
MHANKDNGSWRAVLFRVVSAMLDFCLCSQSSKAADLLREGGSGVSLTSFLARSTQPIAGSLYMFRKQCAVSI